MTSAEWARRVLYLVTILALAATIYNIIPEPRLALGTVADRIVVEKKHHRLVLFRNDAPIKVYTVSLGRGGLERKTREGDNKVPEGLYRVVGRNDRSQFYLALKLSYPSPQDVERAQELGVSPGSNILIHGLRNGTGWIGKLHRFVDWTAGCIAVTDPEIEELWSAVPDGTPVEIRH